MQGRTRSSFPLSNPIGRASGRDRATDIVAIPCQASGVSTSASRANRMAAIAAMRGHGGHFASHRHAACHAASLAARLSSEHSLVRAGEVATGAVPQGVVVLSGRCLVQCRNRVGRGETSDGRDGTEWDERREEWGGTWRDRQWLDRTGCGVTGRGRGRR